MYVLSVLLLFAFTVLPMGDRKCSCNRATEVDLPHGANETYEISAGPMRTIQGRIMFTTDAPVKEAVVEVYEYQKSTKDMSPDRVANMEERKLACLTDEDGRFCISDLPSGLYALRIGTRKPSGWNEMFVKVRVDRAWWTPWLRSRHLDVVLHPGT